MSLNIVSNQCTAKIYHPRQGQLNKPLGLPAHKLSIRPWGCCISTLSTGTAKLETFKSGRKLGTSPHRVYIPLERDKCDIKKTCNYKYVKNSLQLHNTSNPPGTWAPPAPYWTILQALNMATLPEFDLENCTACLGQIRHDWLELLPRKKRQDHWRLTPQ